MNISLERLLWNIAGAERSILEKCPTDHKRFSAIGATILMTSFIAFFAGTSAAWYFTQSGDDTSGNFLWSCAFGLLWATLIFTIDRSLVITLKKDPNLKRQKWAVPFFSRAALAILIAFMVSIPLELLVFESFIKEKKEDYDIEEVGNYTKNNKAKTGEDNLETEIDRASKDIERLASDEDETEKNVNELNNQIERWKQKKNNPSNSSAYIRAKKDYDERRVLYKKNYEAYQQGKIYSKPSYDGVKKAYNRMVQAKANWEKSCDEKIKPLEEQLSKKNKELERVQEQLKLSRTAKNKASDRRDKLADRRLEKENAKQEQIDNGNHFIRNFEILDWAVLPSNNNGKWMDFIFLWMIRLLFFIIEILPTVVKIVTPVGAYDWMVHREEDDIKDYINSTEYSDSLKKMHEIELQAKEELLQQQHEAEKELKRMILDKMREAQFKVANAAITKWESDQILKISGSPNKEDISDTGTL